MIRRFTQHWFGRATLPICSAVLLSVFVQHAAMAADQPIRLESRRALFVDRFLIEKLDGLRLQLHRPRRAGVALRLDRPWEGIISGYFTVIHDGGKYRMYYRGRPSMVSPRLARDGSAEARELTCYAESCDGKTWTRPNLRLFEVAGTKDNNVILTGPPGVTHNFAPFVDRRPGVPASERYKAVGGLRTTGLVGYVSADGIRFKPIRKEPLIKTGAFDSQNNIFWSDTEKC